MDKLKKKEKYVLPNYRKVSKKLTILVEEKIDLVIKDQVIKSGTIRGSIDVESELSE